MRCQQVSVLLRLLCQQLLQLVGHGAHAQIGSIKELLLAHRIALALPALVHLKFLSLRHSAVAIGLALACCLLGASSFIILPVLLLLRLMPDRLARLACPLIASLSAGRREAGLWLATLVVMNSLMG